MKAPAALVKRAGRLLSVFLLALAVIGMHSMGAGHHGSASPFSHGSHQLTAPMTGSGHDHPAHDHQAVKSPGLHADAAAVGPRALAVAASRLEADPRPEAGPSTEVAATCATCSTVGAETLGTMCLAVLSALLAWVLLRALQRRVRETPALTPALRPGIVVSRSPPRRTALSPIEVCVLRT